MGWGCLFGDVFEAVEGDAALGPGLVVAGGDVDLAASALRFVRFLRR